jgi:hypothetical protein
MVAASRPLDPLTEASVSVAWVILANKPFYPVYIWWLAGSGVAASLWTLLAAPAFVAVVFLAPRYPLVARAGVPLVGTVDTVLATKVFGQGAGTELFFAPCMMLAALSFHAEEKWWQRGAAAFIFVVFALSHDRLSPALNVWSDADLATLRNLNAFAVASLMAFIALRWPAARR